MSIRSKLNAAENSRAENGQNVVLQQKVTINVRGEMFETFEHTLSRFPRTLLGSQTKRNRFYNPIILIEIRQFLTRYFFIISQMESSPSRKLFRMRYSLRN